MLSRLDKEAVKDFLKVCSREILKGHCHIVSRELNINGRIISSKQALLEIGIMNPKQLWDYVLELTEDECIKVDFDYDPKRDYNSEFFVFKKIINKKTIYIKLTMRKRGIICLSFHESI